MIVMDWKKYSKFAGKVERRNFCNFAGGIFVKIPRFNLTATAFQGWLFDTSRIRKKPLESVAVDMFIYRYFGIKKRKEIIELDIIYV